MSKPILSWRGVAMLCGAALLAGCSEKDVKVAAPAATEVTVSQPAKEQVSDFVEFTGNTDASDSVDIRARVKGFLKKTNFTDGSMVKKGDLLFEIEPDVFQAEVDRATAATQAAQATLEKANADLAIKKEMAAGNAASKLEVIQAEASVSTAKAQVASSNAALEQAKINIGYTKIAAPLSGRIDRSRVSDGNLVGADGNELLATVVKSDPMYVYFNVDEPTVQRFQARMRQMQQSDPKANEHPILPMSLALGDNGDFRFQGVIDYVDNRVDASTGTIRVRATIANPNAELTPGFFSRIRVPDGTPYQAVLVPERAIGVDQGQKYLLVVDAKNKVEMRPVETGSQQGRLRVVKKGVAADDWVITEGLLRTRPGATVSPQQKPLSMPTTNPVATGTKTTPPQS
jgi:RND family efflux transporter MFP subunit